MARPRSRLAAAAAYWSSAPSLSASASSASRRTNVSSVFQGARTNRLHQRLGTVFPHLLVRRPARSHSSSNVTDRVLESSTRLLCPCATAGFAVVIRIRRIEQSPLCGMSTIYNDGTSTTVVHAQETFVGDLQFIIHPLPRAIRRIFLPFSDFASCSVACSILSSV